MTIDMAMKDTHTSILTTILTAGLGDVKIYETKQHTSKSQKLPILSAWTDYIEVGNVSNNFYFYFMGLRLKRPIPAVFLYPISGLLGKRYALSGHTDQAYYPALTNYEKAYGNVERIDFLGFAFNRPIEGVFVLRYLEALGRLSAEGKLDQILNLVLYETNYGKIDAIDFNAVGGDGEAKIANILDLGFETSASKFMGYNFDVTNAPNSLVEKVNIDWYDTDGINPHGSAVHFKLKDHLPSILCPVEHIYMPTTEEMKKAGLGKQIQLGALEDIKHSPEHWKEREIMGNTHYVYFAKAPRDSREWTIATKNGLDTAMMAYFLTHVMTQSMVALARKEMYDTSS